MNRRSIKRATKATLAERHANFSLDGLKYHFRKLCQYTNPTGAGLDKIPLNTKAYTAQFYEQFREYPAPPPHDGFKPDWPDEKPKQRHFFLRKKAQYQVADHLLGIGKKAYWTGATGQSTLLGLDIDDHQSESDEEIQANAKLALQLFVEMTGLAPTACKSPRGINAFLICHRRGMSARFTNETWHALVRAVNAEAQRRELKASLECKGKARIFNDQEQYCGVLFKDPLFAANPTDEELEAFWNGLEQSAVAAGRLNGILTTLASEDHCHQIMAVSSINAPPANGLLKSYRGSWANQCREWAIHGLPCDDSLYTVVRELTKWLYFIELSAVDESERAIHISDVLFDFIRLKHNGYTTRLNDGKIEEVRSHIVRIVDSTVSSLSEAGKAIFTKLQSQHMKLVPLMQAPSSDSPLSPVKSNECCAVSEWLPPAQYRRQRAQGWDYEPDNTPLPEELTLAIHSGYKRLGKRINKPTWGHITRFLNHLWASRTYMPRVGIESLQGMGFSNSRSRRHIANLERLGLITVEGSCAAEGISKGFCLKERAIEMFVKDGRK